MDTGKKVNVLIENGICKDTLTVWADAGNKEKLQSLPGVINVFIPNNENQYDVWVDPRYNIERVKALILTLLSKSSEIGSIKWGDNLGDLINNINKNNKNDEENMLENFDNIEFKNLIPKKLVYIPEAKRTLVWWPDGTRDSVKCHGDDFKEEHGLAMALVKKVYGRAEFLRIIENAEIWDLEEKKERKLPKTEKEYTIPVSDSYATHTMRPNTEYESELGNQPKERKTVQDACKKCFDDYTSDDINEMLLKFGEGTIPNTKSKYSA
jgi:hypothetical protein